jgi:hypothetical protein
VNGMDGQLRDLLEAAVGEPPHRVSAEAVHRRVIRRRVAEFAAGAVAVAAIAALIPVGIGVLGRGPGPSKPGPTPVPTFTSRHYGYTETLPPGWRPSVQATQQWNGKGAPGDLSNAVDLFIGPSQVEAWAVAAPTKESLTAYMAATIRASHAIHQCLAVPRFNQAITIGGAPARLLGLQCPPPSGCTCRSAAGARSFLVEIAITIHHGTVFVFASQNQNPTATTSTDRANDRAAFGKFLAGIRLQR